MVLWAFYEVSLVCGGSSPIPVDCTTTLVMSALVTLSTSIQDLKSSVGVKFRTQRKVSQSVFGVFGIISVDFL